MSRTQPIRKKGAKEDYVIAMAMATLTFMMKDNLND